MRRLWCRALLGLTLLAACQSGGAPPGVQARPAAAPTTAPPPASTSSTLGVATTPSCPSIPPRAKPDPDRPRYTIRADVRPADGEVDGDLRVLFTPNLDIDRLVFRLWPNGPASAPARARLEAGPVSVAGGPATVTLDDATTLVVRGAAPFKARQPVDVSLPWHLSVPGPANDRISHDGDALRLGSFFPILSWEPGVGWATEPAVGGFAEASTAPTADFDLTVIAPAGYDVLASGEPDPARPGHFTAAAMRDVALSVGRFQTATGVAMAPQPVQVTAGVQQGVQGPPGAYLNKAVAALEDFGRRFGPYPWPTFTLAVTAGLGGGIEYPSHIMQGPGTASVTSHEVGHQWFYALVGNDQGRDPWLDEGLASWAEARFEGTLERFTSRAVPEGAKGMLGEPMSYWNDRRGAYQSGVYVQGVQALAALGDPALVDCALRVYVAINAYRIARPPDLVRATAAVFPGATATLTSFGVKT